MAFTSQRSRRKSGHKVRIIKKKAVYRPPTRKKQSRVKRRSIFDW